MKNYLSVFCDFIKSCDQKNKTLNQILGDLNLLSTQLNRELRKEDNYILELSKISGLPTTNELSTYISLEYNNALLFAALMPNDFITLLTKAVSEKRFYFFFTASDFLLSSKLADKKKSELIFYIDHVRSTIGLVYDSFDSNIYNEIINIINSILEIALSDGYLFDNLVKSILNPFYNINILPKSVSVPNFKLEELVSLKERIASYSKALGK